MEIAIVVAAGSAAAILVPLGLAIVGAAQRLSRRALERRGIISRKL
ncbi:MULTISPECIES: hypothetical protein [unclassified Ensifer]|nr:MULTISPECIES: hypothetical protein [unclassified Ensifer]